MNKNINESSIFIATGPDALSPLNYKALYKNALGIEGIKQYTLSHDIWNEPYECSLTDSQYPKEILAKTKLEILNSKMVVVNLSPFLDNQCDPAAAWIAGYSLAKNIPVFAFSTNPEIIPDIIAKNVDILYYAGYIGDLISLLKKSTFPERDRSVKGLLEATYFDLTPKTKGFKDVNVETTFKIGYRHGNTVPSAAHLKDNRSIKEKFNLQSNFKWLNYQCHPLIIASCEITKE